MAVLRFREPMLEALLLVVAVRLRIALFLCRCGLCLWAVDATKDAAACIWQKQHSHCANVGRAATINKHRKPKKCRLNSFGLLRTFL